MVNMPSSSSKQPPSSSDQAIADEMATTVWFPTLLRVILVLAQVATVYITWPLWQLREDPPLLPYDWFSELLPALDMGWAMVVSAGTVLIWPRFGLLIHGLTILFAMVQDQTREQPEIVSHAFLLLGTIPTPPSGAQFLGRTHLASLWFFAGLHKLLSPDYYTSIVPYFVPQFWPPAEATTTAPPPVGVMLRVVGILIAGFEMALGLLVLGGPTSRRIAALGGTLLHLGILVTLWTMKDNVAIWPWNLALAWTGPALLWNWTTPLLVHWRQSTGPVRIGVLLLALMPLTHYLGWGNPYLAHCLYSANTPTGIWITADGTEIDLDSITWEAFQVPMPPTYRIYQAYFWAVGEPGDTLVIEDPRFLASWWGGPRQEIFHESDDDGDEEENFCAYT